MRHYYFTIAQNRIQTSAEVDGTPDNLVFVDGLGHAGLYYQLDESGNVFEVYTGATSEDDATNIVNEFLDRL